MDFVPVPDPTRKTSTRTRPIPAGTGQVRVYPRVRVDPHTSSGNAVPTVKVFKNAQERNAVVKDKETVIAQSSTLAFTSLLPSLQTTPCAKNDWKLAFNNWPLVIFHTDILVSNLTANKTVH